MSRIVLILGGARSGKSAYAERLVAKMAPPWVFCATAQAHDEEMRERIIRHRARRTAGWITVETPLEIAALVAAETRPVLVDCLTLWLSNLMHVERCPSAEIEKLLAAAASSKASLTFVSNEVGLGIVPDNILAREFRDHAGRLHQALAAKASRVVFMVAGIPMMVKDE